MIAIARLSALIVLCACATGCVTYRNYPEGYSVQNQYPSKVQDTLRYRVDSPNTLLSADFSTIRQVISSESPFATTQPTSSYALGDGYLLTAKVDEILPSVPAYVFGVTSMMTLTILPAWSTRDGVLVSYTLYKDGNVITAKEYPIRRGTFIWLGMLPFAWVNFLTPSEEEALTAATRDFLCQAAQGLAKK